MAPPIAVRSKTHEENRNTFIHAEVVALEYFCRSALPCTEEKKYTKFRWHAIYRWSCIPKSKTRKKVSHTSVGNSHHTSDESIHSICFIRYSPFWPLVLYLNFFQNLPSLVSYLYLIFPPRKSQFSLTILSKSLLVTFSGKTFYHLEVYIYKSLQPAENSQSGTGTRNAKKPLTGFQGWDKNGLKESFKMSPHLICLS